MDQEGAKQGVLRPGLHVPSNDDRLIAALAALQFGRVSRRQLLGVGVTVDAIKHRVGCGRLVIERPGVYAVGYSSGSDQARWATALLDAGPDSMLSHLAAAAAYRIALPAPLVVDITNHRRLRSRPGIRIHCRTINPLEFRRLDGIPITSPAQTLFDLGTMLGAKAHAKAANEAFVLRLINLDDLRATLALNQRSKGAAAFRRLLATLDPDGHRIRSPLEARLNAFLRARGFPPWESNVRLRVGRDTIEADVLWRAERVIVEADGRDPHLSPLRFPSDRRRDRRLTVEGWHPVRVTTQDLGDGADELDDDLRSLLGLPARQ